MNYWIFIFAIVVISIVVGILIASRDKSVKCTDDACLDKVNDSDVSCGEAFKNLELYNTFGGK